jgi:hypothetical protein
MSGDPDENCVSNKELHDFIKAMTELLTKNQASTTTTSPSTTSYCILPSLPSYDGFESNKYFAWEIEINKKFGQCRICERRKLRNVATALMNNALAWWKHLCECDELPKTWNDVKILMRKTFVDSSPASNLNFEIHSLEEEATIACPIVHNILQEVEIKQEKEQKQVHFQEGEHYCLPKISSTTTLKSRIVCFQERANDEIKHMFAASGVYNEMSP